MEWSNYLAPLFLFAGLFLLSAIIAFWWWTSNGGLSNFEKQSRSVFDDDEPEGMQTDFFPGEREKMLKKYNLNK